MCAMRNLRLRQSIGIVNKKGAVEFFRANVRRNFELKTKFEYLPELLSLFDGTKNIIEVSEEFDGIDSQQLRSLASALEEEYVLIDQDIPYPLDMLEERYRLINLLEDFFHSSSEVLHAVKELRKRTVMIFGLGAVGSYMATYLAKTGIGNLVLVDSDYVELSNLHRQYFFEDEIGINKAEALKSKILNFDSQINIDVISEKLDEDFFNSNHLPDSIDLIINCADEPSVDQTSRIIAKFSMKKSIPHIVGGGYNLHLTLIGQTIIPYKTACYKCFEVALSDLNTKELNGVRKLHRASRKLGSFSPLSGIAANLAALDAFKILIGSFESLQQTNKRIEFSLHNHNFKTMEIERNPDCEWCKA